MLDDEASIALVIAVLGLAGVISASMIAQLSSRNQHAREVLFEPARTFARDALNALAAMRSISPPWPPTPNGTRHRNELLLTDITERERRFAVCENATDQVRIARADVRLVFLPHSLAAEYTKRALSAQRMALHAAADFYSGYDRQDPAERDEWRATSGHEARDAYKSWRSAAYFNLDRFFEDVAKRVRFPTWNPRRVESRWDRGAAVTLDARLIDSQDLWSTESVQAANYRAGLEQLDEIANRSDRIVGYLRSIGRGPRGTTR